MLYKLDDKGRIFLVVITLIIVGLIYTYSVGSVQAWRLGKSDYYFLSKQFAAILVGLMFMVAAYNIPFDYYRKHVVIFYFLTLGLLLLVFFFRPLNGAHRWIILPIINIQPSELAKFTAVLYIAHYLDKKKEKLKDLLSGFLPACFLLGLMVVLIFLEPDTGTALMIALVAFILFFISGINIKHLLGVFLFILPFIISMFFVGYRRTRIISFMNPWEYKETSGYQLIQSLISVGSGGIFGKGIGNSSQKLYFLPEIHTDFIFSVISEELGFIGAVLIFFLILYLFYICVRQSLKFEDNFKSYFIFGIGMMIFMPTLMHLGVILGLLPTKGIALPFISYGGSALVTNMFFAGLIIRSVED